MSINEEAAKWGLEVQAASLKYLESVKKVVGESAALNHPVPIGAMQETVMNLGEEVRRTVTKANAEIYKKKRADLNKEDEIAQKVILGMLAIDLKEYKADLENQIKLERAEAELDWDRRRSDLDILESNIKAREVAIIMEKARIEAEINYWKRLQVEAEAISLEAEIQLIYEKVRTAEMQQAIIPYLYDLIAAEYLLVAAEQRRADILPSVIAAKQEVAAIKEEMIPYYLEKADARLLLADAVAKEAEFKRLIEELGYRRIDLKNADEAAKHELRLQEIIQNQYHMQYIQADRQLALAKQQAETAIAQYQLEIRNQLIELGKALEKDEKGYRLEYKHFFTGLELIHQIISLELEKTLYAQELASKLTNLTSEARDDCKTQRESAWKKYESFKAVRQYQYISKG